MKKSIKPSNEIIKTFWWLIKLCFDQARWNSSLYLTASGVRIVFELFTYYATAKISTLLIQAITSGELTNDLRRWFVVWSASGLVAFASFRVMEIQQQFLYYRLSKWSTMNFFNQLCLIDMSDFYDPKVRNEINRINSGFAWQTPNAGTNALRMVQSTVNTVVTIVTVGVVAWWLIPLFILLILPTFLYESKIAKIGWFVWDEKDDSQHIFWGLQSIFTQAKHQFEIRALTSSKRLLGVASTLNGDFYDRQQREVKNFHGLAIVAVVAQFMREATAQAWLITSAIAGKISLEQYFFYVGIVFKLDGAISGLFTQFARSNDELKYANDYRKFMKRDPKLIDVKGAKMISTKKPPTVEFVNASFTYPGASTPVFENLNLKVASGQKIAIVGENGAGKSTIIKLLMRFYELDKGKLLIDGISIMDINIESWLTQVATLFQDFNHYPLTVSDNISISSTEQDGERVKKAAKLAGTDKYINSLKHGYQTYLDPAFKNGVEPSGGLWQRIAVARAFYRNANVIILDEPTSAIDSRAEYEIFNNIFAEHDGKTALIVSHRFSTVRKADRIVVLENGKIIEDGTHEELLKQKGRYEDMFSKQAEGYR